MRPPLRLTLAALGLAPIVFAATPPAPVPATDPVSAVKAAADSTKGVTQAAGDLSQSNSLESKTLMKIMDKVFLTEGGNVNPETGAIMWRNHTYSPEQSRLFRARFERYLSLSAGPEQTDYIALLDRIEALLSTGNSAAGNPAAIREAWQLLYEAADFPADGRTSLNVANQVFNTWRVRDEKTAMEITAVELERLRQKQIAELGTNVDKVAQNKTGETWRPLTNINKESQKRPDGIPDSATQDDIQKSKALIVGTYVVSQIVPALGANNAGDKGVGNTTGRDSTKSRELAETEQKIQALQAQKQTTLTEAKLQFHTNVP
jgi:hypothetical protein